MYEFFKLLTKELELLTVIPGHLIIQGITVFNSDDIEPVPKTEVLEQPLLFDNYPTG